MSGVKLLGVYGSPANQRVEWALKRKGVKYEFIQEDLQNKSPLLLKSNPVYKKIPVLLHNDKPIAESLVIIEYIDEAFEGPSILPKDPYDRAIARFWSKYLDDKCLPAVWKAFWSEGDGQEKDKEEAYEVLKVLDNELKDKKFFGGDDIGFVDIVANFVGFWVGILEEATGVVLVTSEKFPNFCRWRDQYLDCDKVKENMPPREMLLGYYKSRVQAAIGASK